MAPNKLSCYDARGIADYIITCGTQRPKSPYTPLEVIKLTYLCHGWMLGLYSRPFCYQNVEAWKHGPVIADVYHGVKVYGNEPIDKPVWSNFVGFGEREDDLINQVLEVYKDFSGIDLSILTHQKGTPWSRVYKPRTRNIVIPNTIIQNHFEELSRNGEG